MKNLNPEVLSTLKYVQQFAGSTVMVKLGGSVLHDDELLTRICENIATCWHVGVKVVLVHGGGPAINQELTRKGITWEFIDGQRVTTPEIMAVVESVLCGQVNRRIVRALFSAGLNAVGFAGADGGTLMCRRADRRLGFVGHIDQINTQLIRQVMTMRTDLGVPAIPVIAPIGLGYDGAAYNINADWAASRIASSLGLSKMIFLTDQDGILDKQGQLIRELDAGELEELIENGTVKGGMLAKAQTILHAVKNKVTNVHILNAKRENALLEELFTDHGAGTVCRLRSRLLANQTEERYVHA